MFTKRGFKALNRDWEKISNIVFKIIEDIIIKFRGKLYNIINSKGNLVE